MANGHGNCIFAVCCPPESESQIAALAEEMGNGMSSAKGESYEDIARWVLATYDLAPKGSLQPLKDAIRDYAREGYVKAEKQHDKPGNGEGL
jgi:hypothetical protein